MGAAPGGGAPAAAGFTPREAEQYLRSLELFGMSFGLERMHRLTTALGLPQLRFASIHVVGTNGKTSTARMLAAILARHGLRTGLYTSPHITGFAERIEVGEVPLTEEELAAALWRAAQAAALVDRAAAGGDRVTQFEVLTAAAYAEFARRRVRVAVVEAGLGGRYDATNVLTSSVQVLTNIALDHTQHLGETLAEVAAEKLAVVPSQGHLVCGLLEPEVAALAERVAAERHATLELAGRDFPAEADVPIAGAHQRRNFALATAAARGYLGERPLDPEAVARAAAEVRLPGRLERAGDHPLVLLDGAHNPAGMRALAEALPEALDGRPLTAVVAVLEDKDAAGILAALLPLCRRCVVTDSGDARALDPAALLALAQGVPGAPPCEAVPAPHQALARARELAGPDGAVLCTGSITLLAALAK